MPVASGLLESTALRHPGTSPIHVKVMGGLRNASLSFVGPPADRRLEGVYGMGSYAERRENVPLERRATRASELNSRAPCQDEGGAEGEKVPGRENMCQSPQAGASLASSRDSKERPRESQRNGRLHMPHRS